MTTTQLIALLSSPLAPVVIGLVGSAIEKLGMSQSWPRVIAIGKALEAIAADLPKLLSNLRTIASPKDPPAPPGDSEPVGAVEVFPQTPDGKPLSVRPESGLDAEFRVWRHPAWRLLTSTGCAVLLLSCDPRKPPCSEDKLRAIDAAYIARVGAECLPKYPSKEACPAYPALKADHGRELREECGVGQ